MRASDISYTKIRQHWCQPRPTLALLLPRGKYIAPNCIKASQLSFGIIARMCSINGFSCRAVFEFAGARISRIFEIYELYHFNLSFLVGMKMEPKTNYIYLYNANLAPACRRLKINAGTANIIICCGCVRPTPTTCIRCNCFFMLLLNLVMCVTRSGHTQFALDLSPTMGINNATASIFIAVHGASHAHMRVQHNYYYRRAIAFTLADYEWISIARNAVAHGLHDKCPVP